MNNQTKLKANYVLSIGHRCTSQIAINNVFGKSITTPFSWINVYNSKNVFEAIKTKFKDFYIMNQDNINIRDIKDRTVCNINYASFGHYLYSNETKLDFERKIERFLNLLKSKDSILFIYSVEDYMYRKEYRESNLITYYLIKLSEYLSNEYPQLKFKILYINSENCKINDPNIIYIPLSIPNNYIIDDRPYTGGKFHDWYRNAVTKILSDIKKNNIINE